MRVLVCGSLYLIPRASVSVWVSVLDPPGRVLVCGSLYLIPRASVSVWVSVLDPPGEC